MEIDLFDPFADAPTHSTQSLKKNALTSSTTKSNSTQSKSKLNGHDESNNTKKNEKSDAIVSNGKSSKQLHANEAKAEVKSSAMKHNAKTRASSSETESVNEPTSNGSNIRTTRNRLKPENTNEISMNGFNVHDERKEDSIEISDSDIQMEVSREVKPANKSKQSATTSSSKATIDNDSQMEDNEETKSSNKLKPNPSKKSSSKKRSEAEILMSEKDNVNYDTNRQSKSEKPTESLEQLSTPKKSNKKNDNQIESKSTNNSNGQSNTITNSAARTRNQQRFAAKREQFKQERKETIVENKESISDNESSSSSDSDEVLLDSASKRKNKSKSRAKSKTKVKTQTRSKSDKTMEDEADDNNDNNNDTNEDKTKSESKVESKFDPSTIDLDARDDYCSICGHMGNLIVCAYCVCAYHFVCLNIKDESLTPELLPDDWNCSYINRKCTNRTIPKKEWDELTQEQLSHFKWLSTYKKQGNNKYYTKYERADEIYNISDCVMVANAESLDKALIGEILSMFEDQYNTKWVELRWYWLPEETKHGRKNYHGKQEVFSTAHVDEILLESIQCKVTILSEAEYKKREELGAIDDYVLYCNKRYNHDTGEFRPIIQQTDELKQTQLLSGQGESNLYSANKLKNKNNINSGSNNVSRKSIIKLFADDHSIRNNNDSNISSVKRKLNPNISIYEEASTKLQLSSIPSSLPCRESEKQQIMEHLEGSINRGGLIGGIYIAGVPGTGKTATVRQVIRELQLKVESNELAAFDYIELNGMKLPDPLQLYSVLYYNLTGKQVPHTKAVDLLDQRFKSANSRRNCLILLVDELDFIMNKKQNVIYNLFDWPTRKSARLIVIGISNTMDLPQLLMPRVHSRISLNKISFKPYNKQQIITILNNRIDDIKQVFEPEAFTLCAMKVAAVSGDIRRALQICRRAVECAEEENKNGFRKKNKLNNNNKNNNSNSNSNSNDNEINSSNNNTVIEAKVLVGMRHIERACSDLINSNTIDFLRNCSLYEKLFLYSLNSEFRTHNTQQIKFELIADRCNRISASKGIKSINNMNHVEFICNNLANVNILTLDYENHGDRYPLVSLCNLLPDDINQALASDELFSL